MWYRGNRNKVEVERKRRLLTKIQKAHALDSVADIMAEPSWNKRFHLVARLRSNYEKLYY